MNLWSDKSAKPPPAIHPFAWNGRRIHGFCSLEFFQKGVAGETHEHSHVLISGEYNYRREIGWSYRIGPFEAGFHRWHGFLCEISEEFDGSGSMGNHDQVFMIKLLY